MLFKQSKCIHCGTCSQPGFTTDDCPTMAREICGRAYAMEALMAEVEKERTIMEDSGGGVTLCGGEPLMHAHYALELLQELGRRGFHRTVDTSLYASQEVVEAVANECELFLVDLKLMDSEKHRLYTGVGNELILQNIRYLAERQSQFFIRIPLIEGINADEKNMEATAQFLSSLIAPRIPELRSPTRSLSSHLEPRTSNHPLIPEQSSPTRSLSSFLFPPSSKSSLKVHLLPYHDVGKDKHRRMGTTFNPNGYPMAAPSEETLQRWKQQLEAHGLHVIIGG